MGYTVFIYLAEQIELHKFCEKIAELFNMLEQEH